MRYSKRLKKARQSIHHLWLNRPKGLIATTIVVLCTLFSSVADGYEIVSEKVSFEQEQINADTTLRLNEESNAIAKNQEETIRIQADIMKTEQEPLLGLDEIEQHDDGCAYRFRAIGGRPIAPQLNLCDYYTFSVHKTDESSTLSHEPGEAKSIQISIRGRYIEDGFTIDDSETLSFNMRETNRASFYEYMDKVCAFLTESANAKGYALNFSKRIDVSFRYQPQNDRVRTYNILRTDGRKDVLQPDFFVNRSSTLVGYQHATFSCDKSEFDKTPEALSSECLDLLNL